MPEFHRLNKTKTTEMSRDELNARLAEEAARAERVPRPSQQTVKRRDKKISERTKKQMPPTSPARERRVSAQKQRPAEARNKRRRKNYSAYYVMMTIIAAAVFSLLSVTVLFNAEQIIVEGESIYSDERIIEVSELKQGENLVRLNSGAVENRLFNTLVCIDGVKVVKSFPATIKIRIEEAVPMVNISYGGKYYVMSYRNRVIEISDKPGDCVIIKGYVPIDGIAIGDEMTAVNESRTELVNGIVAELENNGFDNIREIDISDELDITINYNNRIEICIGSSQQMNEKLYKAKWLIDKELDEHERVKLNVSNVDRAVARPIVETVATTTAATTAVTEPATENPPE